MEKKEGDYCSFCDEHTKFRTPLYGSALCINGHAIVDAERQVKVVLPISEPSFIKGTTSKWVYRRGDEEGYICDAKGVKNEYRKNTKK